MNNYPKIGIGVMILNEQGKILMGKRKGSHGEGEWAFPGGHLEYSETFEKCIKREVYEECGIEIDNIKYLYVKNHLEFLPKHYIHIGVMCNYKSGKVELKEPEKCEGWEWIDVNNLPEEIFLMSKETIEFAFFNGKKSFNDVKTPIFDSQYNVFEMIDAKNKEIKELKKQIEILKEENYDIKYK